MRLKTLGLFRLDREELSSIFFPYLSFKNSNCQDSACLAIRANNRRHLMRSMRTLRQKRRSSTKLGSKNCVTIFGAEFGSAAAEYGPIRKKLWRQPSSFKQYFQTKLCSKKMWQNRLRFGRDVLVLPELSWLLSVSKVVLIVWSPPTLSWTHWSSSQESSWKMCCVVRV